METDKKIKKTGNIVNKSLNTLNTLMGVLVLYAFTLMGVNNIVLINSPKFKNQNHLERKIIEIREELGMDKEIKINISISGRNSYTNKIGEKEYTLNLAKEHLNLNVLKHEMYHIHDKHCDILKKMHSPFKGIAYLFWYEPQATMYQIFGWEM